MIIKAKHNALIFNFFKWYAFRKIKKHFSTVTIFGNYTENNKPLLVLCNHISWWDGFWVAWANNSIFKKRFYFMMLESQLRKYWFFKYCGGFSVNKKKHSLIESLQYATKLLTEAKNMLLFFPQGEIQSAHTACIKFEKGVEWLLKSHTNNIQIVFVANFTDYFSNEKPTLSIFIKPVEAPVFNALTLEKLYNTFYNKCREQQISLNK